MRSKPYLFRVSLSGEPWLLVGVVRIKECWIPDGDCNFYPTFERSIEDLPGYVVKNPPANAGDMELISGSERSPGEGTGSSLQYSCLENPMERGTWQATVHEVKKSQTHSGWAGARKIPYATGQSRLHTATTEPRNPGARALQQKKPLQWEAPRHSNKDPVLPKIN